MNKPIYDFFTKDHRRIEDIFEKATHDKNEVDLELYHQFRTGLLTHIKMEEKGLFKAAKEANGGEALPIQPQLRLEHGALTALMTVPPTPEVIRAITHILEIHDEREEEPGGMYDACEKLTAERTEEIVKEVSEMTQVPVHPFNDTEMVFGAMVRALKRAGFDFYEISKES